MYKSIYVVNGNIFLVILCKIGHCLTLNLLMKSCGLDLPTSASLVYYASWCCSNMINSFQNRVIWTFARIGFLLGNPQKPLNIKAAALAHSYSAGNVFLAVSPPTA